MPVKVILPVLFKVENADGNAVMSEMFEQTAVARNPDNLIGPSRQAFIEALVAKAVETALAKLPARNP